MHRIPRMVFVGLLAWTVACGGGDGQSEDDDCPRDQTACSGGCADLASDPANCGDCGSTCGDDEACLEGVCVDATVPVEPDPPTVTITEAPTTPTNQRDATFAFACDAPPCTFECSLDGLSSECVSPRTYRDLSDGDFVFTVRARDAEDRLGDPAIHEWTVDTQAPVVTFQEAPADPTNSDSATFVFSCSKADCTFACALDDGGFAGCTSPVEYESLLDGAHVFEVRAVDAAGNVGRAAIHPWTIDTVPPTVTLESGPPDPTGESAATFVFSCNEDACVFSCGLTDPDGETTEASCDSPITYPDLDDGTWIFEVRATDPAGNESEPVRHTWTVDTLAPSVTLDGAPPAVTHSTEAIFVFSCDQAACSFTCRLVDPEGTSAESDCQSPAAYPDLVDGVWTFEVRATDPAGNTGEAAVHAWRIDTVAPEVTLDEAPPIATNETGATFSFACDEAECAFTCRLLDPDGGSEESSCTSPATFSDLADGTWTFEVRATDPAGNESQPAVHEWTVDTVAPVVTIEEAPPETSTSSEGTFVFSCDEADCVFTCRLERVDGDETLGPHTCTSPRTYEGLANGTWHFEVYATDPAGNEGAVADWTWQVEVHLEAFILAGPDDPTFETFALFEIGCDDPPCTFTCTLDDGDPASCANPVSFEGLAPGEHRLTVVAENESAGQSAPVTWTWTVLMPTCEAAAERMAHEGCEYWPVVLSNSQLDAVFHDEFGVVVSNSHALPAEVAIFEAGSTAALLTEELPAGQARVIRLPWNSMNAIESVDGDSSALTRRGAIAYHLVSDLPITAYQFNPLEAELDGQFGFTSDASLLIPAHAFGASSTYVASTLPHSQLVSESAPLLWGPPTVTTHDLPSVVAVVATEDDTTVQLRLRGATAAGDGMAALDPGSETSVTLQRHEVLQLASRAYGDVDEVIDVRSSSLTYRYREYPGSNLSGSIVDADKPVALYAGADCRMVPFDTWACDHLEQQLFPFSSWGVRYVGAVSQPPPGENALPDDAFTIVAGMNGTLIAFTPQVHPDVQLDAGEWIVFRTEDDFVVESQGPSHPILLTQFLLGQGATTGGMGDPSMILGVPDSGFRNRTIFSVPTTFAEHWINVVRPEGIQVQLDGTPLPDGCFTAIGGSGWEVCRHSVSSGQREIRSAARVGVSVYGYDSYVSYGYPAGMQMTESITVSPDW
jgi:hypothetical protein